jgi:hypothetical protein
MQSAKWIRLAGVWLAATAILPGQQTLASRADVKKALDYSKNHQEENIEKQIAIAQIPASPFAEEQRGRYIADEFRRLDLA